MASIAGSENTAPPMTWFTPIAVRSHFPSSRRSDGEDDDGLLIHG